MPARRAARTSRGGPTLTTRKLPYEFILLRALPRGLYKLVVSNFEITM